MKRFLFKSLPSILIGIYMIVGGISIVAIYSGLIAGRGLLMTAAGFAGIFTLNAIYSKLGLYRFIDENIPDF
jgi:hypothetical protein